MKPTDPLIAKILANMPKHSVEPIELDAKALKGNYEFAIDLLNSRKLTNEELAMKREIEHVMTCDDLSHMHGVSYTEWSE